MKTLEIITGLLVGGIVITFILYLAVLTLRSGRKRADYYQRNDKHISPKP